ncbi:MAG TPA: tripartite tricarboxylate transporter TctB family protein [bacterium]|nr:tripartite tricarboxylate transporter TctB family protein [bacterium]
MRTAETVFAAFLLLAAGILLREALRLPIAWTAIGPGVGFFPFWLAVGVSLQAVIVLVRSLRAPAPPAGRAAPFIEREAFKPLLIAFLPMVAVIGTLHYLGLYLGGALYLAGYMLFVGRHHGLTVAAVAILIPLALFFIFERWFLMPMPKGLLLEYLLYGR